MAATHEEMVKKLAEAFKTVEERSKSTDKHWHEIAGNVDLITQKFQVGFLKVFAQVGGFHAQLKDVGHSVADGLRGSTTHLESMRAKLDELRDKTESLRDFATNKQTAAFKQANREFKLYGQYLEAHVALTEQVANITKTRYGIALADVVGTIKLGVHYSAMMNQELIKASADTETRSRLMREIAQVQVQTGADLQHTAQAAKALVNYGVSLRDEFQQSLSIVLKMEEGLGASFDTSAQMVVAVNRIGGSMQRVADSVARVKADTALAADEAIRFATQISKAVMMLKPGSGSLVDQTSEYINRLAGALKELTGSGQDIVTMLTGFTTEAGMMGGASLGATPDFLSNPAQAKQITERFVKYVDAQLNGTSGFQRMATIQLLSEQFNTSADMIVNAHKMLEKYNDTQRHATSLQEEWRLQTSELSKVFSRITQSFKGIIQQVLLPILQWAKGPLSLVADVFQKIASNSVAAWVAGGLFVVSGMALVAQLARITRAMIRASVAGKLYETAIGGSSKGGWVARIGTLLTRWFPTIAGGITRLAGFLTFGTVAASLAALSVGVAAGLAVNKYIINGKMGREIADSLRTKEDLYRRQMPSIMAGRHTRDELLQHVAGMIGENKSAADIQSYILAHIASVRGMHAFDGKGSTKEHRMQSIQGIVDDAGRLINQQKVRLGLTGLTASSAEEREKQEQMIELFKAIARNTEFTARLVENTEKNHDKRALLQRTTQDEIDTEKRIKDQSESRAREALRMSPALGY